MANLIKKIEITLENGRYLVNGKKYEDLDFYEAKFLNDYFFEMRNICKNKYFMNWVSIEEKMPIGEVPSYRMDVKMNRIFKELFYRYNNPESFFEFLFFGIGLPIIIFCLFFITISFVINCL